MDWDPIATDPQPVDWQNPTFNAAVPIDSDGERILGVMYVAQGAGPHPTAILLHGLPGYERNIDLAQVLRRLGWNVLFFHYRGSWGSGGSFSIRHVLEDVTAALKFVRTDAAQKTYRVNAERIVLVGHSLGAFAALVTAASNSAVSAVAALTPYDLGAVAASLRTDVPSAQAVRQFFEWTLLPLQGTSPDSLMKELLERGAEWSLASLAPRLVEYPLLVVDARRDTIAPRDVHSLPLVQALQTYRARAVTHITLDTDHAFTNTRIALERAVVDWIQKLP